MDTLFWEGTLTGGILSWTRVHPTPRLQTRFKQVITLPATVVQAAASPEQTVPWSDTTVGNQANTETVAVFIGGVGGDGYDSGSQVALYRAGTAPVTGLAMREPRANHALARLAGNRVFITGGVGAGLDGAWLNTSEIFDFQTRTFLPTASMRFQRAHHAATTLADGRVLVTGGTAVLDGGMHAPSNTTEIFNPTSGAFSDASPMGYARSGHRVVPLDDGRLLVIGGNTILEAEVYTPSSGLFSTVGQMVSVHAYGQTALKLNNGKVLIVGGDAGGDRPTAAAELFDPTLNIFIPIGSMTVPRMRHFAVLLDDGTVLIGGGRGPDGIPLSSTERFDPSNNTFTPMADLPASTYDQAAAVVQGPA